MNELIQYKICPACQIHNPPWFWECLQCEADLTTVKLTDAGAQSAADPEAMPDRVAELVRRCDCGYANPPQLRKCGACGEDIADIRPAPYAEKPPQVCLVLESADGVAFTISDDEYILGRAEVLADYLRDKRFVSRRHAKLNRQGNDVYLEHLSATNPTFVNNRLIPESTPVRLQNGDEIGLGGKRINGRTQDMAAYFTVRLAL